MKLPIFVVVWFTSFIVGFGLYIFTAAPAWVLMSTSDSFLAHVAQRIYSPILLAKQHSEIVDVFCQEQWAFWLPILR